MKGSVKHQISLILLGMVVLALSAWGVDNSQASSVVLAQPVDATAGDWPMYGHDLQRTNYNPDEKLIGASNVEQLVQRWQSSDLGFNGFATSSGPSIANGKVYVRKQQSVRKQLLRL